MEIERRERDPDTGEIAPSEASLIGEGFGDVFGKIVAKLTGKTAKKLATKAAEKLVEKGAEKVGEKTGQLVGEKFMINFQQSVQPKRASGASELTAPAPASQCEPNSPAKRRKQKEKKLEKC